MELLDLEPGILGFEIRNSDQGIRNRDNDWLLNSSFNHKEYGDPSFKDKGIRNPKAGILNPQRLFTDSREGNDVIAVIFSRCGVYKSFFATILFFGLR